MACVYGDWFEILAHNRFQLLDQPSSFTAFRLRFLFLFFRQVLVQEFKVGAVSFQAHKLIR